MNDFYVTTYCNKAHGMKTGKPLWHECYILPPEALRLERDGKIDEAIKVICDHKPLRIHRGVRG